MPDQKFADGGKGLVHVKICFSRTVYANSAGGTAPRRLQKCGFGQTLQAILISVKPGKA
jgi:hypothetical protein